MPPSSLPQSTSTKALYSNGKWNGYLLIDANDDGSLYGLKVDDALLKKIAGIRSDGNILPLPVMNVKRVQNLLKQNGNKEAVFDVSKLTVFSVNVFSNEEDDTPK